MSKTELMQNNRLVNERFNMIKQQAVDLGPNDPFTRAAQGLQVVISLLLLPTIILIPITTAILAILITISFGLLLLPLSLIWLPFLGFLFGTSWLWIKAPIMRPFLLIPGVLVAQIGQLYTSLIPDMGEKYQKVLKLGLCETWPLTILVLQATKENAFLEYDE